MILITKIKEEDYNNYTKNFTESLNSNINNSVIKKIIIFTDAKDLKVFNKKVIISKINADKSEADIIEEVKKSHSNMTIMWSNPFCNFDSSLSKLHTIDDKSVYYIDSVFNNIINKNSNDVIIFNSNVKTYYDSRNKLNSLLDLFRVSNINISDKIKVSNKRPNVFINNKSNIKRIENVNIKSSKIDVIIVSVNYNDFLLLSLTNNKKYIDNITVVTSSSDTDCQDLCNKLGVKCVITDRMYENGAEFNKGKAINDGIKSIINPDWILVLDSDIILTGNIDLNKIGDDNFYTSGRYLCNDYTSYKKWQNNEITIENIGKFEKNNEFGFFQLFNFNCIYVNKKSPYPESFNDASNSDLEFKSYFPNKAKIDIDIIHLGEPYKNWKGRITDKFISDDIYNGLTKRVEVFDFNINEYFDKIYCINLERRKDRWSKVSQQFIQFKINVEKWTAVDGENISDELFQTFNPKNITGEEASEKGIVENKNSIGCLLSHLEVIKDARSKGYKKILIFEDDVILSDRFNDEILKIKNLEWKLLYIGASQFKWNGIEPKNGYYLCDDTLGTFAYAIDSSIYDNLINLLEKKDKSIDNSLSEYQGKNIGDCYTIFPNIVISNVVDSDIRESKEIEKYASIVKWNIRDFKIHNELKVLLLPDVRDWAFDNISKSVVKYNPYPEKLKYEIIYIKDIQNGYKVVYEDYDYIFVFFEAERIIPNSKKVIRGCYSAFWLEDSNFSEEIIGGEFSDCYGAIFANDSLKKSISKYLPIEYPTCIIHDSSDELLFYPIENIKEKEFSVIFVGNTKRKIKNFEDIKWICKQADVNLIVCKDIKNKDLVNYYNKADLCINFSDFEGGPQTFIEAALCEVPMIIKSNNELSKLIPCFTGETSDDFINLLIYLKDNREICREKGKQARKVSLEKFTYKETSKKFADFFLNIDSYVYKNDLSKYLTVFVISCGENPNYDDCVKSLSNQTVGFQLKFIKDISPMSAAFQRMIDDCKTDYYIQVDEDMILFENSIEVIYKSLLNSTDNVSTIAHMLKDVHLNFKIYGIKGYKHKILRNYPYNLEIISCEVEQLKRLQQDGYETLMTEEILGYHSPKWTPELIYERYFDLMEKWKNFKYHWMEELPSKLLKIFQTDPSEINLYALMGAMCSISIKEHIRKREKNFEIEDENFQRIKKMTEIKDFKFIKDCDIEDSKRLSVNIFKNVKSSEDKK